MKKQEERQKGRYSMFPFVYVYVCMCTHTYVFRHTHIYLQTKKISGKAHKL
jgi:hypothetical protein